MCFTTDVLKNAAFLLKACCSSPSPPNTKVKVRKKCGLGQGEGWGWAGEVVFASCVWANRQKAQICRETFVLDCRAWPGWAALVPRANFKLSSL